MYHVTDLTALHLHEALLERGERELELRRRRAERQADDGEEDAPRTLRHRRALHRPRLALR